MARHPFAGMYLGSGEQPTIEKAITNSWFCYSSNASKYQMAPPPGALRLDSLPGNISLLFEKAFSANSINAGRPGPNEWIQDLEYLEKNLVECQRNSSHKYYKSVPSCPWCVLEGQGAVFFSFNASFKTKTGKTIDVKVIWKNINDLASPGSAPSIASPSKLFLTTSPLSSSEQTELVAFRAKKLSLLIVALVVGCIFIYNLTASGNGFFGLLLGGGLWLLLKGIQQSKPIKTNIYVERAKALKSAKDRYDHSYEKWEKECGDYAFKSKKEKLNKVYS